MFYLSKGEVGVIVKTMSGDSLTALKIRPLLLLVFSCLCYMVRDRGMSLLL